MYESMISSRVRFGSGGSMTTSQCSKSQPSRRIVSFGGRLLQFGDGSFREDVVGRDENDRRPPMLTEADADWHWRPPAARMIGRRRGEKKREAARNGESRDTRVRAAMVEALDKP